MHLHVLIPLLTMVGAGGLASAILAREPGVKANRLVASILACAGFWACCEVFLQVAEKPEIALIFARWSSVGSLMLAPLCLHLAVTALPELVGRFGKLLRFSYVFTVLCVLTNVTTPWYTESVTPSTWGWSPVMGPMVPFEFAIVITCPLVVAFSWLRKLRAHGRLHEIRGFVLGPVLPLLVATATEFSLPMMDIAAPRLGSASIVAWGAITFWTVYRFREPVIAPRRFAREILATLPTGVVLLRLDGRIRTCNGRMAELVGCDAHELMGVAMSELVIPASAAAPESGREHECELRVLSGDRIPVSISDATLRDDDGETIGFVVVVRDLREVVALRGRLITSGRLAAVGQLAAGITHEINNPIAYVRSNLSLLRNHWEQVREPLEKAASGPLMRRTLDEGRDLLRDSSEGVDRIASIVRDVGGLSQTGPETMKPSDIRPLLDTAVRVATPRLRGRIEVVRDFGPISLVECVPEEMIQVFLNLLLNAAQAIDGNGTIRLETQMRDGAVVVRVHDDGRGMSREMCGRIFESFFTTKPAGEGTGLGLAISRQIIDRHGGEIDVTSEKGRGTTFEVRLPAQPGGDVSGGETRVRPT